MLNLRGARSSSGEAVSRDAADRNTIGLMGLKGEMVRSGSVAGARPDTGRLTRRAGGRGGDGGLQWSGERGRGSGRTRG